MKLVLNKATRNIFVVVAFFILYSVTIDFLLYYSKQFDWLDEFLTHSINVLFIYLIYRFSLGGKRNTRFTKWSLLKIFAGLIIFAGFNYIYFHYLILMIGHGVYYKTMTQKLFIIYVCDVYARLVVFSITIWYFQRGVTIQQKLRISETEKLNLKNNNLELEKDKLLLQSQNLQLQNEKLKVQYDFLKAQINPHFLYNTLSFFYSKTAATDMETAEGIALLTDIMRYSLQQGEADGKVGLEDEVAHLNSYIRLQQMRFNNTLNIEFWNDTEIEKYRILPHVFITLVENAFKHGEVNNPMHSLKISLKEADNKMIFLVKNKIQHNPVINPGTGVGLNNIRNRVKMEYGDAASLENNIANDFFTVSFSVPLALLEKLSDERPNNNDARPVSLINKKIAL